MVLVAGARWTSCCKDAGSPGSGTTGTTEDAAARRPARPCGTVSISPTFLVYVRLTRIDRWAYGIDARSACEATSSSAAAALGAAPLSVPPEPAPRRECCAE